MLFNFFTCLLAFGAVISQTTALPQTASNLVARDGINCQGSSQCAFHGRGNMGKIQGFINNIDTSHMYNNGDHVACVDTGSGHGICAFLQNSDQLVSGSVIHDLIAGLVDHGCKNCGSNPVSNYGSTPINDPQGGILTVNYVANTDNPCDGLCG